MKLSANLSRLNRAWTGRLGQGISAEIRYWYGSIEIEVLGARAA